MFIYYCKRLRALTLSVKTTPSFQMWYLVSMELNLSIRKKKLFYFMYIYFEGQFLFGDCSTQEELLKYRIFLIKWKYQARGEERNTMVDVLPGNQRSFFFHSFHGGVKVQGALVQAQKLSDAFSAVQVAVLVYHLHNDRREGGSRGQRR